MAPGLLFTLFFLLVNAHLALLFPIKCLSRSPLPDQAGKKLNYSFVFMKCELPPPLPPKTMLMSRRARWVLKEYLAPNFVFGGGGAPGIKLKQRILKVNLPHYFGVMKVNLQ